MRWPMRRRAMDRVWTPPHPVPDNDTVVSAGFRRWSDLLQPRSLGERATLAWLISPLLTRGGWWRCRREHGVGPQPYRSPNHDPSRSEAE